jgi:hypothetical protein
MISDLAISDLLSANHQFILIRAAFSRYTGLADDYSNV